MYSQPRMTPENTNTLAVLLNSANGTPHKYTGIWPSVAGVFLLYCGIGGRYTKKVALQISATRVPDEYYTSQEVFMSACTVWELVLTLAVVVLAGLAFHYRNLASRMKTRARIYIQYVPREQLTGEERVVLEDFKKDLGLT